jgi:tetratricopeptide (TPR) repeat protein
MQESESANDPTPAWATLERPDHGSRSWRRFLPSAWKALALMAVLGTKFVVCKEPERTCEMVEQEENDGLAVLVCQREYDRTQDPATGVRLANALRRSGDLQGAEAIANGLRATPAQSDALQVLGRIAVSQNRLDEARSMLEDARRLHLAEHRPGALAIDDQVLANILTRQKKFADALRKLDACIIEAREGREARDRITEAYCHLSAGQVLARAGYFDGAEQELNNARRLLTLDRDLAQLEQDVGGLYQERALGPHHQNHNRLAAGAFKKALKHARAAQKPGLVLSAELNLAYSLAETEHLDEAERHLNLDEAERHLEEARMLDRDERYASDRAQLAARIAYRRGDLTKAAAMNDRVYDAIQDDDDRLHVCIMQARIALVLHQLDRAKHWAQRGVALSEKLRMAQSAIELRSWVLSARRQPHELLFTALARARNSEAALIAFDHWQGRTLLDLMSREPSSAPPDLQAAAVHTKALHDLLPRLSNAPIMAPADPATIMNALRSVDLVALLVAEDEVWRITARHGTFDITDIGPLKDLLPKFQQFRTTPHEAKLAGELGTLLLPDDGFLDGTETLRIVLDGTLSDLPIAALRRHGRPLIASRPIVHAPRVSEVGCVPSSTQPRHAVVLADAEDGVRDLPAARREAEEIATLFGVTSAVGERATRDALFAATRDDLLHVAVHGDVDGRGGSLRMYDGPVSALEISARRLGPSLVLLSTCLSAVAEDGERATALSTAFLANGSRQVIATLRSVNDDAAQKITSQFYRSSGASDPVRALAQVQAELSRTSNTDWPHFVIFGHDVCPAN